MYDCVTAAHRLREGRVQKVVPKNFDMCKGDNESDETE